MAPLMKEMDQQDMEEAMRLVQAGKDIPLLMMDGVRKMLEEGIGHDVAPLDQGRRSIEGRVVAFTNRVNALALGMTRFKMFRERQGSGHELVFVVFPLSFGM
jgi:hypothetical protein